MSISTSVLDSAKVPRTADSTISRVVIVAVIVLLAHAPLIFGHFQQLWLKPHYQLYPMVLVGGFALVWPFKKFEFSPSGPIRFSVYALAAGVALVVLGMVGESMTTIPVSPAAIIALGGVLLFASIPTSLLTGLGAVGSSLANPRRGFILTLVSCVMLAFGVFFASGTTAMLSALLVTAATAVTLGGRNLFWRCLPALAYLLLVIPPPFGLDTMLVMSLQKFAAKLSSRILDLMGVMHNLAGVTIEVGKNRFEVENACSGISSLLSTLACVGFYVLWFRIHWLRASILILASVFWVLINNMARIVSITYFEVNWGINLSRGLPHQILGMLLFAVTLLLIWSTDRLLMFIGRSSLPVRRFEPLNASPAALESGFRMGVNLDGAWYRSVPIAVACSVMIAAQAIEWWAYSTQVPYSGSALSKLYDKIDVAVLPETFGRWARPKELAIEQREATNPLGQYSRIWKFTNPVLRSECAVSLDYPYPEYHDLRICYENSGWTLGAPRVFTVKTERDTELQCVFVEMQRPVEQHAALWFCNFDQDGVGQTPNVDKTRITALDERIVDRFAYAANRWQRLLFPTKTAASTGLGSILQVQLLARSYRPFSDPIKDDLQKLFSVAAERLHAKCVDIKNQR